MKLAHIQKIKSVENHNNADSLDIVRVSNYDCIVKRGVWKVGDLCVFIEPDSVLPDKPWASFYKSKSSRIRAIRLRGVWSMGVVESIENVGLRDQSNIVIREDEDVTEFLAVTKYEPPAPQDLSASGAYGLGIPKTDEHNWQSLREVPYNEICDITLKIDGQSASFFCKLNEAKDAVEDSGVGGRSFIYKSDSINNYTTNEKNNDVLNKLTKFCLERKISLCVRAEQFGHGIQASAVNPHSKEPLSLNFYSTWLIDERRYARKGEEYYIHNIAPLMGLRIVPILEKDVTLTQELIEKYDQKLESIDDKPFEGVVVEFKNGSFKIINKFFDSKK